MRIADVQLAFPYLLLAIAVIAVLGPSLFNLVVVLGLRTWVVFARVVRGAVLATKPLDFVQSALASGASTGYVIVRHVLPNVVAPITVLATVEFANLILLEATLSFLGLGVQPPFPSWGMMLSDARRLPVHGMAALGLPGRGDHADRARREPPGRRTARRLRPETRLTVEDGLSSRRQSDHRRPI